MPNYVGFEQQGAHSEHKWWITAIVGVVALAIGFGLGSYWTETANEDAMVATTSVVTTTPALTTTAAPPTTAASTTTTTRSIRLIRTDFQVDLVMLEKKCLGSAGADIHLRPDLTISERAEMASGKRIVVFEIDPVENGPETYNLEADLDADSFTQLDILTQTGNCDDEPVARVKWVLGN